MAFLIFSGLTAFIFGILLLCFPKTLHALSEKADKLLAAVDKKIYDLRIGVGISLILVSALTLFIAYYLVKRF